MVGVVAVILVVAVGVLYYRKRKFEKDLELMLWKIDYSEIVFMKSHNSDLGTNVTRAVGFSHLVNFQIFTEILQPVVHYFFLLLAENHKILHLLFFISLLNYSPLMISKRRLIQQNKDIFHASSLFSYQTTVYSYVSCYKLQRKGWLTPNKGTR